MVSQPSTWGPQRKQKKNRTENLFLLKADIPIDPELLSEVLLEAGVETVRFVVFGTKQPLNVTLARFRRWVELLYLSPDDVIEMDLAILEVAHAIGEPSLESRMHSVRHAFSAVSMVDRNGFIMPYSYNKKTMVKTMQVENYPQFGSILGSEFGQGSVTVNLLVRLCCQTFLHARRSLRLFQ